jgi:hypothetical protein
VQSQRKASTIFQNSGDCGMSIIDNDWSYALGRFLGRTINMNCGIHMHKEGIYFGVINYMVLI